jgi:antitoxin VapB
MKTAKIFRHGGSQAVRLPKEFRFEGHEVLIEKRGSAVVLRPRPGAGLATLGDLARYFREKYPESRFPDIERPRAQQKRDLDW